jgi:glycosyltransferase involved in cell wall biosynthesis
MNILLLTSDYLPNVGGMATHAHQLARAHVRNGHTVRLIVPIYGPGPDAVESGEGFTVHRLHVGRTTPRIKHLFYIAKVRRYILDLHAATPFDVLHWHDLTPNCWTTWTLRKVLPLVWTNHTSNYLEFCETEAGRRKIRRYLHHPRAIISPSMELHEKSAHTGVPRSRLFYIPNGVDADVFRPGNSFDLIDKDYAIDSSRPVIVCPRRLEPKNGVEYFIRSIPIVRKLRPDVQFMIVGGGFPEERARFEALLREAGETDGVYFTGNVSNSLMPKFLALSQIAALPSLMEATSISGLEAMASGLPLVGTTVGGIPEIIEDGVSGLLVEPRNPAQLAEAFLRLLEDPSLRARLGEAARARVLREFSWTQISLKTIDVYSAAIGVAAD